MSRCVHELIVCLAKQDAASAEFGFPVHLMQLDGRPAVGLQALLSRGSAAQSAPHSERHPPGVRAHTISLTLRAHEIMLVSPYPSTAVIVLADAIFRHAATGGGGVGCGLHDLADKLPGVPMSAIKVALRVLLQGDWIYDALGAGDVADAAVSAQARWMYVGCVQQRVGVLCMCLR